MIHLLYLDPGSGSYLIQVIIAGALGVIFFFKIIWNWIKNFFTNGWNLIKSFFVKTPPKTEEEKNESAD